MRKDGGVSFYYCPSNAYPRADMLYSRVDSKTGYPTKTRRTFGELRDPEKWQQEYSYVLRQGKAHEYRLYLTSSVVLNKEFMGAILDDPLATIQLRRTHKTRAALAELATHVRRLRDQDVIKLPPEMHINILIDDPLSFGVPPVILEEPNAASSRRYRP